MMEAYASRQQKAIVGYLRVVQPLPVFVWLHRMIPRFNAQPTVTEGLWVSRPDGGGWQEIGHVRKEDSDDLYKKSDPFGLHGDPANRLEDIHWLPDGKQVYFRYHGVLYVAPAVPEG